MTVKVLFVCLGNICRSPTAHSVFQKLVDEASLQSHIEVDSAGTGDWHIGRKPDSRSAQAAAQRGYDLSALRARQVIVADFDQFDYILAMDTNNLQDLQDICPLHFNGDLALFLSYGSGLSLDEVPDPYYGSGGGFDQVLDLVENASAGLLTHIKDVHF